MDGPKLEVADIFRRYGQAYREMNGASMSTAQRRVMTAIEVCRTAALGGQIEKCDACGQKRICYRSCRNRHCNKCQSLARAEWIEHRQAELLNCEYYHVVFTVPNQIAAIAYQNKEVVYNILFQATAETLRTIANDPKHLGAEIGLFAVLHSWGSSLTHHPHLHCVVPGGGLSPDGARWVPCRPGFFLPVRALSRLFRRLFLEHLQNAFDSGKLRFFTALENLRDRREFARYLESVSKVKWVVYAKRPFAGPEQVLDYVGRYTHRVAISNNRLLDIEGGQVSFRYKDYRNSSQQRTMTLPQRNSSVASSSTFCHAASTASVITASSATDSDRRNLLDAANYLACRFSKCHRSNLWIRITITTTKNSPGRHCASARFVTVATWSSWNS
jgi:hypothetical protein